MTVDKFDLYYRVITSYEKKILIANKELFDGIILNSNFAAFYDASLPNFINRLEKPFLIDPYTFVFQYDIDHLKKEENLKKSYNKLFRFYQDNSEFIGDILFDPENNPNRTLTLADFKKENGDWDLLRIRDFAEVTLLFQRTYVEFDENPSLESMSELLGEMNGDATESNLKALISPYFFPKTNNNDWLDLSFELANAARELKEDLELYAVLCIPKTPSYLQNQEFIDELVNKYSNFDGYIIYLNDFDETTENLTALSGYKYLVERLSTYGKPIISFYGGFFSLILSKFGMSGTCSGINLLAKKNLTRFFTGKGGGGGGVPRYYVPQIKKSLPISTKATTFYETNPALDPCDCDFCTPIKEKTTQENSDVNDYNDLFFQNLIQKQYDPDQEKEISLFLPQKHFLACRKREANFIVNKTLAEVIEQLRDYFVAYYPFGIDYLERWISVFSD